MAGVGGVRLVIVAQVSVRMRMLSDRAVRAGLDDFARRAEREDAPVEHQQPVENLFDAIQIMGRDEHRHPLGDELAHDFIERLFGCRVHSRRRLYSDPNNAHH